MSKKMVILEPDTEDKLKKIELFYKEVRKDFPITDSVRTEGIAHADDYASIEPYKLSVTPIIAAAEIMFQNYEVDYTLIDEIMSKLDDDEKEIIRLRYFSDKSQSETALITGYSQAKVSRIESKSLHKLRDYYS